MGLGKLGLPCALALAKYGSHRVTAYDISEWPWNVLNGNAEPPREEGIDELIAQGYLFRARSVPELVEDSDVVFVAVQTPHAPDYDGSRPMPDDRRDFDYAWLVQACRDVCAAANDQRKPITLAVVSTVLPGTCNRLIRPLLGQYAELVYTPLFIAMGTTIHDFCNPEFVICGCDMPGMADTLREVYRPVHGGDLLYVCSVETAEAIKVLYNTAISCKVVLGNAIMEICHKTGADCDGVIDALALATDRVISAKYLRGGMGDGGHCHPRDLIAMSWLAQRLELSYDLLGQMAVAREAQTAWLAGLVRSYAAMCGDLDVVILGRSYKPGSDLTGGSPAVLLAQMLDDKHPETYDPYVLGGVLPEQFKPAVFVIATAHQEFYERQYPRHSVIIDPFGKMPDQPGVTVVRVGRK